MKKYSLIVLLTLLFAGCASAPQGQWPAPSAPLNRYALLGKVAIITPKERHSANLYWQHLGQQYSLKLTSFLGTRILSLDGQPGQVTLVNGDGTYHDSDPQRLLYRLTGWQLPISSFNHWLLGQAGSHDTVTAHNAQGQLQSLASGPWQVRFSHYQQQAGRWLPGALSIRRDSLFIKLQINQWQPR
ncbi:lipoprotein insertase outer membrane protein LolB [Gallaecimonas sp. GXIMD1310]|uniref:lipoprotein insertase outer membrane protein LolB n=1 Tax=Gallaecimonas sp. GXIMD1310 TaxID=3131926 RepID=UPI003253136D